MIQHHHQEKGRFQYSTDELMKFSAPAAKHTSFGMLFNSLAATLVSAITAHQLIYLIEPKKSKVNFESLSYTLARNLQITRRPIEHTCTVFTLKLFIDLFEENMETKWSEYTKGGFTGLISYLFSRPLDQIDLARQEIFVNQKKSISRLEGLQVVLRHEGFRGLYKNENLLAPLSVSIYRSIYFGMWHKLNEKSQGKPPVVQFLLTPFVASLSASLASALPDKFRSYCFQINDARNKSLQKVYRKPSIELKATVQLLVEYITSKEFRFTKMDVAMIGYSVVKNWVILGLFGFGQYLSVKWEHKDEEGEKVEKGRTKQVGRRGI